MEIRVAALPERYSRVVSEGEQEAKLVHSKRGYRDEPGAGG
jgi:hypothetical protein